ncbi:hypothetical protein [Aquimarina sp. AU58]|uniref:hypothetical protein n=1 Tax=Aquimarina sp. AU58 TaxID=1874112 RepID=UPI00135CA97E|nr:hypothetical protein [Aquimarina sp. AU58]
MSKIIKNIFTRLLFTVLRRQNNTRCWSNDLVAKLKREAEPESRLYSFQTYIKNRTNGWNAYKIRWETTPANRRNDDKVLMDINELNFIDDYANIYSSKTSNQIIREIVDIGGYDVWKKQFKDNEGTGPLEESKSKDGMQNKKREVKVFSIKKIKYIVTCIIFITTVYTSTAQCWIEDLFAKLKTETASGKPLDRFQDYMIAEETSWVAYQVRFESTPVENHTNTLLLDVDELQFIEKYVDTYPKKPDEIIAEIKEAGGYDAWKKNLTAVADDDYKNILKLGKNNTPIIIDDSAKNIITFSIDFENEIHEIASFELRNGRLIQFVNIEDKFKLKNQGIGKGMFHYAFDRLGGTNTIDRIPDKFINRKLSDNFDHFQEGLSDNLTPEQAALATYTGKWVKDKYPFVKIDPSIVDKIKNSSSTDLIVVKPEFVKTAVESVRPEYLESLREDIEKFPGYFVDNEVLEGWKVLHDLKIECTKDNLDFLQNYSEQNPDKKWNWISNDIYQKGSWETWVASLESNSTTGSLWKVSKLKSGEKSYKDVKLLDRIGHGEHKEVFPILGEEDKVIVILKKGTSIAILNKEIEALKILSEKGYPTVEILQKTIHNSQPAIVMKRYEESSDHVLKLNESNALNASSIEELQTIREKIDEKEFVITDLQFLIAKNGTVVIADPILFFNVSSPEFIEVNMANNYNVIDELIDIARKNMGIELENPVWKFTKDIEGWTKEVNDKFVNFVDKNPDIGDLFRTADNDLERKKLAQSWLMLKDHPEFCKDSKILDAHSKITRIGKYSDDVQPMRIDDISTQGFLDNPNKIKKQQDFIKLFGFNIGEPIYVIEGINDHLQVASERSYYRLMAMLELKQPIVAVVKKNFLNETQKTALQSDISVYAKLGEEIKREYNLMKPWRVAYDAGLSQEIRLNKKGELEMIHIYIKENLSIDLLEISKSIEEKGWKKWLTDSAGFTLKKFGKENTEVYRSLDGDILFYYVDGDFSASVTTTFSVDEGAFSGNIFVPEYLRGKGIGYGIFTDAFNEFKKSTDINIIEANWKIEDKDMIREDNFHLFKKNLKNKKMTPNDAANATHTGRWADALGFEAKVNPKEAQEVKGGIRKHIIVEFVKKK